MSWQIKRIKDSNGFVSKRILRSCQQKMEDIGYAFSAVYTFSSDWERGDAIAHRVIIQKITNT